MAFFVFLVLVRNGVNLRNFFFDFGASSPLEAAAETDNAAEVTFAAAAAGFDGVDAGFDGTVE